MRTALVNLLVVLTSSAFILGALEVGLRLYGDSSRRHNVSRLGRDLETDPLPGVRYLYHAAGSYTQSWPDDPRGYFGTDDHSMVYRLNNYGFRDDDFEIARNHRIRIAAIGDSYCWGTGVKEQHRFTALLEAGLEQASVLGQHYEIYNFCLPGFNTQSEVALYEQVVWHFRPDLLLVSFVLNDVNLRNDRFVGPPESEPGRLRKWRERFRIADWVAARIDARRVRNAYVADVAAAYRRGHPGFESVVAALERLARRNRPSGIPTLLVIFPWIADLAPGRYPFHAAHRAVREAGEARGFEVVELFGFFAGRDAEELWIHRVDQHPNQVAHRIAADAIQPRLGEVLTRSGEELLARAEQRRIRPLPRELGAAPTRRWYEAFAAANSDR